jgi:putative Mg2+ transporter-C (MgtC) family protein
MILHPSWADIALRLLLTMVASAILGFNRGARGHAVGLRTTILVGLAASVAMIQANILLTVGGRAADSFGSMDLMRLPLGILTGVGFIGGGAILRRGDLVTGVTTAATLWVVTVIGLCFGGGQLWLGVSATLLAVITLSALKWLDMRLPREHRAMLVIQAAREPATVTELGALIGPLGYRAYFRQQTHIDAGQARFSFEIGWRRPEVGGPPLDLLRQVSDHYPVISFKVTSEPGR